MDGKTRVLIADDDAIYREMAAASLPESMHATTVADGAEALAALRVCRYDIVIVDLEMPEIDGLGVMKAIRSSGLNVDTPVIVITGHDDANAIQVAYDAGATSFLAKPLNWVLFGPHVEFVLRSARTELELRDAINATEFLGELKSRLMNALGHEFREPLRTLLSLTELMRQEVYGPLGSPQYRGFVTDMGRAIGQINSSLMKLLWSGRALMEQLSVRSEPIDLGQLISEVVLPLQSAADRRGVLVSIKGSRKYVVQGDKALLGQALRGMLESTLKLAPRGSEVSIDISIAEDGGLCLAMTDVGSAPSEQIIASVNGDALTARPFTPQEHRDVCLEVAKVLFDAHQGRLNVRASADGNVSTLTLPKARILPVGEATGSDVASPGAPSVSDTGADVFGTRRKDSEPAVFARSGHAAR
ncbi:MAG TPA: hybrid sensor histidine kinase/response regulator [Hyphomicrobiaceae bacterium]|nr:hybrid sensor histidine kinase/response regulator [Hyphomicrobiaceae bacterium]